MVSLKEIKESLLHSLFPHVCVGCGSDLVNETSMLCMQCISELPETKFHLHSGNPVEKIFWGRLPLVNGTAQYYFTKESLMQRLMHQFKYRANKRLGEQLGQLIGNDLRDMNRFKLIDALVPLPLFPAREKRRGYNQATVLCEGMAEVLNIQILNDVIVRILATETQTKKGRMERWENIQGKFLLIRPETIRDMHLLLVDDVITTGATLEACGQELLKGVNTRLSIATLCFASR
jgi:ComF family protein